jgi:anti-sigma factor RsiW
MGSGVNPVAEHLTEQQIAGYRQRQMAAPELLAADRHLAACEECRRRLAEAMGLAERFAALRADIDAAGDAEPEHLTFEQILAYAEDRLGAVDRDIVTSHLALCPACRSEAEDLRTARADLARSAAREFVPVARPRRSALWRRPAPRYAFGLGAAATIAILAWLVTPLAIRGIHQQAKRAQLAIVSVTVAGTELQEGDRVDLEVTGFASRSRQRFRTTRSFLVSRREPGLLLTVEPGVVFIAADVWQGVARRPYRYGAFGGLGPGRNQVQVVPIDRNVSLQDLARMMRKARSRADLDRWLGADQASRNYFDDVKVYAGGKVFLDESFDRYRDGTRAIPTMKPLWGGKDGYVTHALHAPGSAPGCWANEAYPGWNREDIIEIRPEDVPPGEKLTFEASIFITDPRKGVCIGLTHPDVVTTSTHERYHVQYSIALLVLRDDKVTVDQTVNGGATAPIAASEPGLFRFDARAWHHIQAVYDPARRTLDVCFDGRWKRNVKMPKPEPEEWKNRFTAFAISGTYFANIDQ